MRLSAIITFASLIATRSAAALVLRGSSDGGQDYSCGPTIDADFEDKGPQLPAGVIKTVGLEKGLFFKLSLSSVGAAGNTVGLIPRSPPNIAVFGISKTLRGPPSITTLESGTIYKTFNLQSFYFGCTLPTIESAARVLTSCTISATGYRAGNQIAKQEFTFTAPLLTVTKPMVLATATGFTNVDTVEFAVEAGSPLPDAVAVLLDNFLFKGCN